jgi:Tfp pilus assembly PilM family ATPase
MPRKHHTSPIGIDFDYNEFRAVQYGASGNPLPKAIATIPRSGSRKLSPTTEELVDLARSLNQRGFYGNRVAIAVPKRYASFHILDLPPEGSGAPISRLALLEAQRSGAHTTNDLEIGYWTQPKQEGASKRHSPYYTVACQADPLNELIDNFESAQLLPIKVEPIETAITRTACQNEQFTDDAIHSIIEIGWDESWAIITLGSTPVYTRQIDIGASRIRRILIDDHALPSDSILAILGSKKFTTKPDSRFERIMTTVLSPLLLQIVDQLDTALTYVSQQHRFAPFGMVLRSGYFVNEEQTAFSIAQRTGMPTLPLELILQNQLELDPNISQLEYLHSPRLNIAAGLARGAAA